MQSSQILSPAFQLAQLRSEKIRITAIMAALVLIAVFIGLRLAFLRAEILAQDWLVVAALFAAALAYEWVMFRRLGRAVQSGQDPGFRTWILNVFVETLFPTLALIASISRGYTDPYLALVAPTVLIYFIFIVLSTLRLDPLLSLMTGVFSASGYMTVSVYVLIRTPRPESTPASLPMEYYLTYTFIILLAGLIAALVARQIRNHVRAALLEAHEAERLKSELETARSIQQGLLPRDAPQIRGYEIAAWNKPADETGGDYYNWQSLAGGKIAVTLADVTGHGIGAALVASACHAYSRASLEEDEDLASALGRINRLLARDLPSGKLITFAAGVLAPDNGRVELLSAGHGPLLLYRASDDRIESFPAHGIPFGVLPDIRYGPVQEIFLDPGDILVLITDGFFEWMDSDDEQFGLDRLENTIRASKDLQPDRMISRLYDDVTEFARGTAQQDDLTAVVVKRCL